MLIRILSATILLAFAGNASAVLISEAGSHDTRIAYTTLSSSGSAAEETWIESELGSDITYTQLSGSGSSAWESVDTVEGGYAFDFGTGIEPSHYLVKTGGGSGTGTIGSHFLFENLSSLQWAYVRLSDFGDAISTTNVGVISHVGRTDGGSTRVPEPGALTLLGAGLLGLGLARRRRRIS